MPISSWNLFRGGYAHEVIVAQSHSSAAQQPATGTSAAAVIRSGMANEQEHPEPVIVGTFASVGEAEIAQARLRASGIDSALVDNDGAGTIPVDSDDGIDLEVRAAMVAQSPLHAILRNRKRPLR